MGPPDDLSGRIIAGKYELLRLVGRGGMGSVYEARVSSTLKRCAVKLLHSPELADDVVLRRFFREARASGLIQSRHVVTAFDSGTDPYGPFYVMEYLVGEDLEQTLRRLGALNQDVAVKIVFQAALGLAKAHELGIVHRDVKPGNLFLAASDVGEIDVKVLDFGVAKVKMELMNEAGHSVTRTGSLLGTPLYMSPEQLKRAASIDASADVWSLGVLLFECLTGSSPWGEVGSLADLILSVLTADLPKVQDRAPWVRPELARIVNQAISRDTQHRQRDARELCEALKPLMPTGTRLTAQELSSASEAERLAVAPRFSFEDTTVAIEPTPVPAFAKPSAAGPLRFRSWVLGSALIAGTTALLVNRLPKSLGTDSRPQVARGSAALLPAARDDAPAPLASVRLALALSPNDAEVTVDDAPAKVLDGKIMLEGRLGSALTVRVSRAGQSIVERVAITSEGLVPAQITLPLAPRDEKFAKHSLVGVKPTRVDTPPRASAASSPTPPSDPAAGADLPSLSAEFE